MQAALELKPELSDYATQLLRSEQRAVYDSTHSTLKMIGELRIRLGLDTGRAWFLEHCLAYAFGKNAAKSLQDAGTGAVADTLASANPAPQQRISPSPVPLAQSKRLAKRPAKWPLPAVLLITGVILIAVLLR